MEQPRVDATRITICMKSQDGDKTYYRVKRGARIQKLLVAYARERNMRYTDIVFLHHGKRVRSTKSPNEMGMENNDEIDAMVNQNGGGILSTIEKIY